MAYKYLQTGDLQAHILNQLLTERNGEDTTTILETLELQNIAIIKSKLKGRYNTEEIFGDTPVRHWLIVKILTKLVLYDYVRRNASRKVPSDYVKDWEWAQKELEKIKAGKERPDGLPEFVNENGSTGRIISGSNKNTDFHI